MEVAVSGDPHRQTINLHRQNIKIAAGWGPGTRKRWIRSGSASSWRTGGGGDVRVHETRTCCQLCRHLSLGRFLWMSVAGRKRPAVLDLASHEHDARWPRTQVKQSLQMDNLLGVGREDTTSDRQKKKKKRKEKDVTVGLWDWWGRGGGAISAGFSEVRSSRDLT